MRLRAWVLPVVARREWRLLAVVPEVRQVPREVQVCLRALPVACRLPEHLQEQSPKSPARRLPGDPVVAPRRMGPQAEEHQARCRSPEGCRAGKAEQQPRLPMSK